MNQTENMTEHEVKAQLAYNELQMRAGTFGADKVSIINSNEIDEIEMPDVFISITQGMRGYFAVLYAKGPEDFIEPFNTGHFSYDAWGKAVPDAIDWACAEEIPFVI